jgi:hypothetical protein
MTAATAAISADPVVDDRATASPASKRAISSAVKPLLVR